MQSNSAVTSIFFLFSVLAKLILESEAIATGSSSHHPSQQSSHHIRGTIYGRAIEESSSTLSTLSLLIAMYVFTEALPNAGMIPGFDWQDPVCGSKLKVLNPPILRLFGNVHGSRQFQIQHGLRLQSVRLSSYHACPLLPEYRDIVISVGFNTLWAMCTVGCGCKPSQRSRHSLSNYMVQGTIEPPDLRALVRISKVPRGYDPRLCSYPVIKWPFIVVMCGSNWLVLPAWNEMDASRRSGDQQCSNVSSQDEAGQEDWKMCLVISRHPCRQYT